MQAWMWRLTDDHAVIYTEDKATLKALFAYSRFPHQDLSRATTYERKNGRVFAWQFTFPISAWNGVVRHLGRSSITMLDQERWISSGEVSPPTPTPIALPVKAKKSNSKIAVVLPEQPAAAPRTRKPAPRPAVDLTQPLQPMSGVVAKAKAAKPRVEPKPTSSESMGQAAMTAGNGSPAKKRTASPAAAAEERATKSKRQTTQPDRGGAPAAVTQPLADAPPANPRNTKPAPAKSGAEPGSKARAGARSKASSVEKSNPLVELAGAPPAPTPRLPRPVVGRKPGAAGSPPAERSRDAGAAKRWSADEERLLAELAEVQLRLAALTESAPPVPPKGSGRLKAAQATAPAALEVKGEAAGSALPPENTGARRRSASAPEPAFATMAPRGTTAVLDAPASSAPGKRGRKPRQHQE